MDSAEIFSLAHADYVRLAPVLWDPIGRATAQQAAPNPGDRVLDACCGIGSSALPLADAVGPEGRVDAIDIAPGLVEHLRDHPGRPDWLHAACCDVTACSLQGLDQIVCTLGVFFLPDMTADSRALVARLRPGGRFTVAVWDRGIMSDVALAAMRARAVALGEPRPGDPDVQPRRTPAPIERIDTPSTLREWLERDLGLTDVSVRRFAWQVPADPDTAWLLVTGSGFRGLLHGLEAGQLDVMRRAYLAELGEGVINASVLLASGRR